MTADAADDNTAIPAATAILLTDTPSGPAVLMVRRNTKLEFAGGTWVFPGGRVDPEDDVGGDALETARRAAARESMEEAGVLVAHESLVTFSHWTPPAAAPKRFATWFFLGIDPGTRVIIDDGEVKDHLRIRPCDALERHHAGEIELTPPTWITLHQLCEFESATSAVERCAAWEPENFVTHIGSDGDALVAMYHGDAGYEDHNADASGPRHRLIMSPDGWSYERTPG